MSSFCDHIQHDTLADFDVHWFLVCNFGQVSRALVCCLFGSLIRLPYLTTISCEPSCLVWSTHRRSLFKEIVLEGIIEVGWVLSSPIHPAIPNSSAFQRNAQVGTEDCVRKVRDILSCKALACNISLKSGHCQRAFMTATIRLRYIRRHSCIQGRPCRNSAGTLQNAQKPGIVITQLWDYGPGHKLPREVHGLTYLKAHMKSRCPRAGQQKRHSLSRSMSVD